MREYELVTIFPAGEETELAAEVVERISTLVCNHEGKVRGVYHWGRRKFAYPIDKLEGGFYVLFKLDLEPDQVRPLDDSLNIEQTLMRHLLVTDNGGLGPVVKPAIESRPEEPKEPKEPSEDG